ncbi:Tripartite tricarboxylate transporter TctB family protein [Desulfacinum hydrothermale DSM 13146]|uniref:Tripartite tricarboxylate transporter TctB family protein n=1 Tax=Desulfacinum hydrothermale DSM 13146 TaxID=1121390 RepID=A0A1W1XHR8_9BACT|nr:tripartite tricarboxylate transporter TctB family protein [Desulfacinum hydrothermale]SMC23324.1 Tripartite tricarboxylate transporter TctB family protein [Desulfacinum hydrothermale DSM 13146]
MNREINTDIASGLIGLLLTGLFYFGLEDVLWMSIIFPEVAGAIMDLLSIILIIKGLVKPSRSPVFKEGSNLRWIVTGVLFFCWVMVMPVLGFFVSTVLFMSLIVIYLARARTSVTIKKILVWVPIVIAEVTFFYVIFTRFLYIPLPEGMFF